VSRGGRTAARGLGDGIGVDVVVWATTKAVPAGGGPRAGAARHAHGRGGDHAAVRAGVAEQQANRGRGYAIGAAGRAGSVDGTVVRRPRVVIYENSKGLWRQMGGDTRERVESLLMDCMAYEWEAMAVSPHLHCGVGARRPRVFYIGVRRDLLA
jgi:hypothetical protein